MYDSPTCIDKVKKIQFKKENLALPFNDLWITRYYFGNHKVIDNIFFFGLQTTRKTREALEKEVNTKIAAAQPTQAAQKPGAAQYIRYTPSQQGVSFNSGAKQRVIRMVEMQKDPMEPPRFK